MAEAMSHQFTDKDLTECGICLSIMDKPKALPCLHSFCLKCLSEWAKGKKDQIRCPLCMQEFPLPQNGVKGFITNFFINTLKERKETADKLQAKDAVIPCNCCGGVDQKAEAHCVSCGGFVCGDCIGMHSKVKNMSSHKLISFEDLRSGKVDIRTISQQKYCKTHEGQVLWFYCETCGVLICRDCTVVDHSSSTHILVNLEKASKGQGKEIGQLVQDYEVLKKKVTNALKSVESTMADLEVNEKKTQMEIDVTFDEYKRNLEKMLEEKREAAKSEVNQAVSQRKKQLETEKEEIELQQTRIDTALQMASDMTHSGSKYDIAVTFTSLQTNLSQLRDMTPIPVQKHLGKIDFKPQQVGQPVMPSLGTLSLRKPMRGEWKLGQEFGKDDDGKLMGGRGIAVALNGDNVVANFRYPERVVAYNKAGQFKYNIDTNQHLKAGETSRPWGVAVSSDGEIFVTQQTSQVHVYDNKGAYLRQFPTISPGNVSSDTQKTSHQGITIDNHRSLLVAEVNKKYISRHRIDGTHIKSFTVSMIVWFIAVNRQKHIFVSGEKPGCIEPRVQILDESGQHLYDIENPTGDHRWHPYGLCCTEDDGVYIASFRNPMGIYRFSSETGAYLECITKDVCRPSGLALIDDGDKLLVAQDHSVKVFALK